MSANGSSLSRFALTGAKSLLGALTSTLAKITSILISLTVQTLQILKGQQSAQRRQIKMRKELKKRKILGRKMENLKIMRVKLATIKKKSTMRQVIK